MNPQVAASYRAGHSAPNLNFPCYLLLGDRYPQTLALFPGCDSVGQQSGRGSLCSERSTGVTWAVAFCGWPQAWSWCRLLARTPQFSSGPYLPSGQLGRLVPRQRTWGLPAPHAWAPNPVECPLCPSRVVQSPGEGTGPASGWSGGFTDMDERGRVGGAWWQ